MQENTSGCFFLNTV